MKMCPKPTRDGGHHTLAAALRLFLSLQSRYRGIIPNILIVIITSLRSSNSNTDIIIIIRVTIF